MKEDKRRKQEQEDDGRVIAKMNVEGMPWYTPRVGDAPSDESGTRMTKQERNAYVWAAVKSALLIFLVFAVVFLLFLLFCTKIWLT